MIFQHNHTRRHNKQRGLHQKFLAGGKRKVTYVSSQAVEKKPKRKILSRRKRMSEYELVKILRKLQWQDYLNNFSDKVINKMIENNY